MFIILSWLLISYFFNERRNKSKALYNKFNNWNLLRFILYNMFYIKQRIQEVKIIGRGLRIIGLIGADLAFTTSYFFIYLYVCFVASLLHCFAKEVWYIYFN